MPTYLSAAITSMPPPNLPLAPPAPKAKSDPLMPRLSPMAAATHTHKQVRSTTLGRLSPRLGVRSVVTAEQNKKLRQFQHDYPRDTALVCPHITTLSHTAVHPMETLIRYSTRSICPPVLTWINQIRWREFRASQNDSPAAACVCGSQWLGKAGGFGRKFPANNSLYLVSYNVP